MKLNALLTQVFSKLGVDISRAELQTLLANASLATIDVDDVTAGKLSSEFYTLESAKQNPAIRSAIRAEVLNGIDAQTAELMAKFDLDDETQQSILAEDKTSKKYAKLVETIANKEREKSSATGSDKTKLSSEIAKLNEQIVKERTAYETKIADGERLRKTDRVNWELDSIYGSLDYAMATDKNISATAARAIVDMISKQKGVRFETTETGVKLLTSEGTDYFDNNVPVTPQDFIKKTLMESKMLKVSDTGTQSNTTAAKTATPNASRKTGSKDNFMRALDGMLPSE
jgi:hypothetical protein